MTQTLGPSLGVGRQAEVFAYGAHALKLYNSGTGDAAPFREAALMAQLQGRGLPTPRAYGVLEHDGRWGVVMDRVQGPAFAEAMAAEPNRLGDYISALATLQTRIHATSGVGFPKLTERLASKIAQAEGLSDADRARLLERLAAMPAGTALCHGDFHPYNVMGALDAPVVIDWIDATEGHPAADFCRSYVLLLPVMPGLAELCLEAATTQSTLSRQAILDWVPTVAAARLAEALTVEERALLLTLAKN